MCVCVCVCVSVCQSYPGILNQAPSTISTLTYLDRVWDGSRSTGLLSSCVYMRVCVCVCACLSSSVQWPAAMATRWEPWGVCRGATVTRSTTESATLQRGRETIRWEETTTRSLFQTKGYFLLDVTRPIRLEVAGYNNTVIKNCEWVMQDLNQCWTKSLGFIQGYVHRNINPKTATRFLPLGEVEQAANTRLVHHFSFPSDISFSPRVFSLH